MTDRLELSARWEFQTMSTSPVRLTLADNLECDRFPDIDGTASRDRFRALVTDRARQTWQDVDVQWGDVTRADSPEDSDLWRDLVNDEHDRGRMGSHVHGQPGQRQRPTRVRRQHRRWHRVRAITRHSCHIAR